MFSKLRKLVGKDEDVRKGGEGDAAGSNGVRSLEPQLQRKFGRGVQYNMKIVIRGDKNVGKTALFLRLQGLPFKEEYMPSEEIQVANIPWSFKASDDIVKVEIWDVVDKSKKRRTLSGLKLNNSTNRSAGDSSETQNSEPELGLDAETLDVYKGTHGAVLMMDLTKIWTFDYVKREVERIPPLIPVLILVNHRDMGHHQATSVNVDQVRGFVQHLERPPTASAVIVAESSMRNGFGLKYLHKFLNLPFLQLQREALENQLEHNQLEMRTTHDELESLLESEEQNYNLFIDALSNTRRKVADKLTPPVPPLTIPQGPSSPAPTASPVGRLQAPPAHLPLTAKVDLDKVKLEALENSKKRGDVSASSTSSASKETAAKSAIPSRVQHIDEFIPEDNTPADFLEETTVHPVAVKQSGRFSKRVESSDDEEDGGNPMVAGFTDEIELDHVPVVPVVSYSRLIEPKSPKLDEAKVEPTQPTSRRSSIQPTNASPEITTPVHSTLEVNGDTGETPECSLSPISPVFEQPVLSVPALSSPIEFNHDEFSSWLSDVEKRNAVKSSPARKYSAGLVTATSLDDSRVEGAALDTPQDEPEETVVSSKKKSKKKTGDKKKVQKASKKAVTVDDQADSTSVKIQVSAKPPTVMKRELSETDPNKVLERELEDFLASDND